MRRCTAGSKYEYTSFLISKHTDYIQDGSNRDLSGSTRTSNRGRVTDDMRWQTSTCARASSYRGGCCLYVEHHGSGIRPFSNPPSLPPRLIIDPPARRRRHHTITQSSVCWEGHWEETYKPPHDTGWNDSEIRIEGGIHLFFFLLQTRGASCELSPRLGFPFTRVLRVGVRLTPDFSLLLCLRDDVLALATCPAPRIEPSVSWPIRGHIPRVSFACSC